MQVKYDELEKVWTGPDSEIDQYCGMGEAILSRLKEDDQERVIEVFYDKSIQLTVGEIRRQTITVAKNLQRIGVKKGDRVVLYSVSNEKITPITFACYTIGAPVNFFETNLQGDDISQILQLVDPALIIFEEKYRQNLFAALESLNLKQLKHIISFGSMSPSVEEILFQKCSDIDSFQPLKIEDPITHPATLMLTSGTTGLPKVMLVSHAHIMEGLHSWWKLESGDKVFCFSPLRWISQVSIMLQPVFYPIQRVYTSQAPSGLLGKQITSSFKITHFFTVPAMYSDMLRAAEASGDTDCLSSLKIALLGGEVVSQALVDHLKRIVPNCKPLRAFGMTEFGGVCSSDEGLVHKNVNGGALKIGMMAKIIDDNNQALGPNEKGQMCIKRKSLPYLKYLNNDKANRETFLEGGWLNTGDYGYMDSDNLLNVVTRYKYLVRSRGNIIIPTIVEDITVAHPQVLVSVLVGHPNPDEPKDEIGTLFILLQEAAVANDVEKELRELIKRKCTKVEVQAVRHIRVVSDMPLTSCGKIDRGTLKDMACSNIN